MGIVKCFRNRDVLTSSYTPYMKLPWNHGWYLAHPLRRLFFQISIHQSSVLLGFLDIKRYQERHTWPGCNDDTSRNPHICKCKSKSSYLIRKAILHIFSSNIASSWSVLSCCSLRSVFLSKWSASNAMIRHFSGCHLYLDLLNDLSGHQGHHGHHGLACDSLILSMIGPVIKVIIALWSPLANPRNRRSTWW